MSTADVIQIIYVPVDSYDIFILLIAKRQIVIEIAILVYS